MPWKNGGGETSEIAISPPAATLDALDWRVSMAVVSQDGPFSIFPGVDRTLSILDGAGMDLDFGEGGGVHAVTAASAPLSFGADRPLYARLRGGTITDLNVMTRRDRYRHTVQRLEINSALQITSTADQSLVFCERGEVTCVASDGAGFSLEPRDCIRLDEPSGPVQLTTQSIASVYLIQFYRVTT